MSGFLLSDVSEPASGFLTEPGCPVWCDPDDKLIRKHGRSSHSSDDRSGERKNCVGIGKCSLFDQTASLCMVTSVEGWVCPEKCRKPRSRKRKCSICHAGVSDSQWRFFEFMISLITGIVPPKSTKNTRHNPSCLSKCATSGRETHIRLGECVSCKGVARGGRGGGPGPPPPEIRR